MHPSHQLFDRTLYRKRHSRNRQLFCNHNFLHIAAEERVLERLQTIDRDFEHTLIIGATDSILSQHQRLKHIIFANHTHQRLPSSPTSLCVMDEEWLPFQENSLDAVICVLNMHHVNDVAGTLIQIQQSLKPDGLLLMATYGARTLMQLREAYAHAESQLLGGISPRISPFMEARDAGGLLQRAGFALPVADNEMLTISYPTLNALLTELRGMGETNIMHERSRQPMTRTLLAAVDAAYRTAYQDAEGRLPCDVEMLFLTGWKPHASQQKPAQRGSGTINLNDVFTMTDAT
jgi:NADH dehydrogenase [ubiquinone] 1 alpha subcomplex assembly factor 5